MKLLHGVRFIEDEFYLRCGSCWTKHQPCYWPLTLDFWNPVQGLTRCRACWSTYRRTKQRDRKAEYAKYRAVAGEVIRMKKRDYYVANRDRLLEQKRARRAALKAEAA